MIFYSFFCYNNFMNELNFLKELLLSDDVINEIKNNKEELFKIIPELSHEVNFEHKHPYHHLDVWEHSLLVTSLVEKDFELRLCALLHDIGKPFCYEEGSDGIRHFRGHPIKSAEICNNIFKRLNINEELSNEMLYLILNHDTMIDNITNRELEIKRLKLQYADTYAHNPSIINKRLKRLDEVKKLLFKI